MIRDYTLCLFASLVFSIGEALGYSFDGEGS